MDKVSRGQEGGKGVFSPTGSAIQATGWAVTNERATTSRAKLFYGHQAPGNNRPRTATNQR